jgi:hypothetical protein
MDCFKPTHNQHGSALVVAMMILLLLTVVGLAASRTTIREYNSVNQEARYKQSFMVTDSGQMREAQEIGNGGYEVTSSGRNLNPGVDENEPLRNRTPSTEDPMSVGAISYQPEVTYRGVAKDLPIKGLVGVAAGLSPLAYDIDVQARNVTVDTVYVKVGLGGS